MNSELQALLAVQQDDEVIRQIEARLATLLPRYRTLEAALHRTEAEVARGDEVLARETQRLRSVDERLAEGRVRLERSLALLESASRIKEATAASAQVETARRMVGQDESELLSVSRRVNDLQAANKAHREELDRLKLELDAVAKEINAEKNAIEADLADVKSRRESSAKGVDKTLLSMYERISTKRRTTVVYALHEDFSCGACDTAIPLQRRPAMMAGSRIEPCEVCGVLLYFRAGNDAT